MRRNRFLTPCWTNSKGGEKLEGRGWGRGRERPPARKLAFSSSPSLVDGKYWLAPWMGMSIKICQPSNSPTTAGAAMWWKNVFVFRFYQCFAKCNGKDQPKGRTETCGERNAVWHLGFARDVLASFTDWPFSKSFANVLGGQIVTACVLVVFPLRDRSIWLQRSH